MAEKCKECGCECGCCTQEKQQRSDMHLHAEIESLRQRLMERDSHIVTMETQFLNEADKFPNGELASLKEELLMWQEKYSRLCEAHKRVQKVNQNLEDKLLRIVDKCETEKGAFTKDIATLSHRLADANYTIHRLTQDNEKYRNDVNLAIQLLQCKPSNFVGQKYESLPPEVQAKVRNYVSQKRRSSDVTSSDVKSITVPISTFPPTAMVYNVTKPATEKNSDDDDDKSKPPVDVVSAAIMAKVLEDREKERIFAKHCDTCTCHRSILTVDAETQTDVFICNECSSRCGRKSLQTKDNVMHEVNENVVNGKMHCAKHANCQSCSRDKSKNGRSTESLKEEVLSVNLKGVSSKKNNLRRNDVPNIAQGPNENFNKQSYQKVSDSSRTNLEKPKQIRVNRKPDVQIEVRSNTNYWDKFEKKSNCDRTEYPEKLGNGKEQSHIDIINDRLWKNEWTKLKTEANSRDSKTRTNSDVGIDVINDRVWRNDRSERNSTQLTLIEVKSVAESNQNDSPQTETATSPSYSSDSVVISTSDPSSSSSDVVQSVTGTQFTPVAGKSKSTSQNRMAGPRNCLVRVTPGSKNILLDNAGHYKSVLYTSGSNKTGTALVHAKKQRSTSERSTSSEENSPLLLQDNNQLQRVAEWVKSSACMDNSVPNENSKTEGNLPEKRSSVAHESENVQSKQASESSRGKGSKFDAQHNGTNEFFHESAPPNAEDKDLISFDVPTESQRTHKLKDLDYEVKITKEMEETYLKLAASLDPVALSLSSTEGADLTIEKYRKDHRKHHHIQRLQEKISKT